MFSNKYAFKIFLFLVFLAPSILLLVVYGVISPKDHSAVFLDLQKRCLQSIELAEEFDSNGLKPVTTQAGVTNSRKQNTQTEWLVPDSPFGVLFSGASQEDPKYYRCYIYLADGHHLDANQQASLIREFTVLREKLRSEDTHRYVEFGLRYPVISFAFAPVAKNARGCSVISTFTIDIEGDSFSSSTGEQVSTCVNTSE